MAKEKLWQTFRNPGEFLLKTSLKDKSGTMDGKSKKNKILSDLLVFMVQGGVYAKFEEILS